MMDHAAALPKRPSLPSSGLETGVEIGDFRIERRLGAGGMGSLLIYALPLVTGVVLGGTALWGLLSRLTGQWFRFARELRAEHRRVRHELAI